MPFNGSGIFTIINTFTPGTTISSSAVNANYTDIATGLSDCLTRDGQAGMTAALKLINGNTSVPALAFGSEPTLGLYRSAAATMGVAGSLSVTADVAIAGALTIAGLPVALPVGLGPLQWSGTSAPSGWVLAGATYSRATYAALWTFAAVEIAAGNTLFGVGDGSTTFTIATMDGYVPVGVDAAAARIAGITHVGDTAGSPTHTLTASEIPSITSANLANVDATTAGLVSVPQNATLAADVATTGSGSRYVPGGNGALVSRMAPGVVAVTSNNTGGLAHSIVQSVRAFRYIIYAGA